MPISSEGVCVCKFNPAHLMGEGGRTIIFPRLGYVEYVCETCWSRPDVQRIFNGEIEVHLYNKQVDAILASRRRTIKPPEAEKPEDFDKY